MEQLTELLERKRALTAEFVKLKGQINIGPNMGLMGLIGTDLKAFAPIGKVITELLTVQDQITEVMATKLTELAEQ